MPENVLNAWIPTIIGIWGNPDEGFKRVIIYSYNKCKNFLADMPLL